MDPRGRRTWVVAALFFFGTLATPIHLLVDLHEVGHHDGGEAEEHEHSHHEPHPVTDHQIDPVLSAARSAPVVVDVVALTFQVPTPDVPTSALLVEADANSPPSCPESLPASSRAPPL